MDWELEQGQGHINERSDIESWFREKQEQELEQKRDMELEQEQEL